MKNPASHQPRKNKIRTALILFDEIKLYLHSTFHAVMQPKVLRRAEVRQHRKKVTSEMLDITTVNSKIFKINNTQKK